MWGISIHSLRMEGDGAITTPGYVGDISIHSLRMEGDSRHCACGRSQLHFNPLPPHGGRLPFSNRRFTDSTFQSTPSAWRETHWHNGQSITRQFQSTPSAWRETSQVLGVDLSGDYFNPLPPHGGRLCDLVLFSPLYISFQSTPSAWRETRSPVLSLDLDPISIHSLRMEGDAIPIRDAPDAIISIHSLRMEGDDRLSITTICRICISIHSLRMEGD